MPGEQTIYDFKLQGLEGQTIDLNAFRGRKILIVNTASECGFTAQYAQLQELHDQFSEKVAIIGCPSNDFGNQEPGSHEEIARFCQSRFGLKIPLSAKMRVSGPNRHPLYAWLEAQRPGEGTVQWNFQKFLVDEQGKVSHVFAPAEDPLSEAVLSALDVAL